MGLEVGDRDLVRAARAGDGAAAARLVRRMADTVWTSCCRLTRDETAARDAFETALAALQADRFSRLDAYDGRSRLDTFVALVVRDVLGSWMSRLLAEDAQKGWRAFETLFGTDLQRLIRRRLPGSQFAEARQDAYQEICAGLVAGNCHRLAAYNERGSFAGFVLHMADRLLIDFIRSFRMRRRMPAAITRLAALDQELFRLVWWRGMAEEFLGPALVQRFDPPPSDADIAAALERVRRAVPVGYRPFDRHVALSDVVETDASPEMLILAQEEEHTLNLAANALNRAAAGLSEEEQLYLRLMLAGAEPLPARETARLMQCPVEDVYRLRQRLMKKLKERLADDVAIKNWLASV